jgi:ubiquinone/menaquinone biosynthesis C-methylase UbiE
MKINSIYVNFIEDLHSKQLQKSDSVFIKMHLNNKTILKRHVDAFFTYLPYVKTGKILDWGCKHGFYSCLLKYHYGEDVILHGCDILIEPFEVFFDYANLNMSKLSDPYKLPYDDNTFDSIIGSGVVEHVPNDFESLKELYRILKPEGILIITFLPNKYSYIEFISRALKRTSHNRLYTIKLMKSLLLHSGFIPTFYRYHQFLPSLAGRESKRLGEIHIINKFFQFLYKFNILFENLWLINKMSTNILIISRKKVSI